MSLFKRLVGDLADGEVKLRIHAALLLLEEYDDGNLTMEQVTEALGLDAQEATAFEAIYTKLSLSSNKEKFLEGVQRFLILGEMRILPSIYRNEAAFANRVDSLAV